VVEWSSYLALNLTGLHLCLHLRLHLHPRLNRPCSAARQFLEPTLLASQDSAGMRIYARGGMPACVTSSCSDSQIYAHDVCETVGDAEAACPRTGPEDLALSLTVQCSSAAVQHSTAQYSTIQYYDATTILHSTAPTVLYWYQNASLA
jgi:hypothetical protein